MFVTRFEVVCCLELGDAQVYNHLVPIARHPMVSKLWIVRAGKSQTGDVSNSEYVLVPRIWKPLRWLIMLRHCLRLARRKEVAAFVSFNPFPYGLISSVAAGIGGKPIHFGLIGSDWYRDSKGLLGRLFRKFILKGSFFTVTGKSMQDELVADGFDGSRISILPHSVDLETYPVADPGKVDYTAVYVGQIIKRKNVDTIIHAFDIVVKKYPEAKLCIVGRGPLENELKSLVNMLGLEKNVDFAGYQKDVRPYLARAGMNIIASSMEGFPFSLVEGICTGVIPVTTPVGTIADEIRDGENGLIFPAGDSDSLADCILRLLDDPETSSRLRGNVIKMRDRFSYDAATAVWDGWFKGLSFQA